MNFREKLARFFYGRNGSDDLSRFLSWAAVAALLLSSIVGRAANGWISMIFWLAGLIMVGWSIFRTMSKDLDRRRRENMTFLIYRKRFLSKIAPALTWVKSTFRRLRDLPKYKYLTCPSCRSTMRVPRGKGTIMVTCRKCGERFKAKS